MLANAVLISRERASRAMRPHSIELDRHSIAESIGHLLLYWTPSPQLYLIIFSGQLSQDRTAHTQRRSRHAAGKAYYDGSGHFVGAGNEDCGYDSNPPPLPDTREVMEPE
jgi:hypothetical protein